MCISAETCIDDCTLYFEYNKLIGERLVGRFVNKVLMVIGLLSTSDKGLEAVYTLGVTILCLCVSGFKFK